MQEANTDPLLEAFNSGHILAYPTEAVYGLGCDPDNHQAVLRLLALKKRPVEKGLILVVSNYSQALPFVDDKAIPMHRRPQIFASWPGPTTWLLPKSEQAPVWITGDSDMIAIRVSAHAGVKKLCDTLGKALVSTSANFAGAPPIRTAQGITQAFADKVVLLDGELGDQQKPSRIMHSLNGQVMR